VTQWVRAVGQLVSGCVCRPGFCPAPEIRTDGLIRMCSRPLGQSGKPPPGRRSQCQGDGGSCWCKGSAKTILRLPCGRRVSRSVEGSACCVSGGSTSLSYPFSQKRQSGFYIEGASRPSACCSAPITGTSRVAADSKRQRPRSRRTSSLRISALSLLKT